MDVLVSCVFALAIHGVFEVADAQGCQRNVTLTTWPNHFLKGHIRDLTNRNFLLWQMKGCNGAKMKMIQEDNSWWSIVHKGVGYKRSVVKMKHKILASTKTVYLRCDAFVKLWLKWDENTWSMGVGNVVGVDVIFTWTHPNLTFSDIKISSKKRSKVIWTFYNGGYFGNQASMILTAVNMKHNSSQSILSTIPANSAADCAASCFTRMSCSSFCFIQSQSKCELLSFIPDLSELVDYPGASVYSLSSEGRISYEV